MSAASGAKPCFAPLTVNRAAVLALPCLMACLMACLMVAGACADSRQRSGTQVCYSYNSEIQPVLETACESCHGATTAEGGYRIDSTAALFALGTGDTPHIPRIIPGDDQSAFLAATRGESGHPAATDAVTRVLEDWIVRCEAGQFRSASVHPLRFLNPNDDAFHSKALAAADWNFEVCIECHTGVEPDDTASAKAGPACTNCHVGGATGCSTCHGDATSAAPPAALDGSTSTSVQAVGLHRLHVEGGPILGKAIACAACHTVPTGWDDVGHIRNADGTADAAPAEVTFGDVAIARPSASQAWPSILTATYDRSSATCTNVYCHQPTIGTSATMLWTNDPTGDPTGADGCQETCHDTPPANGVHRAGLTTSDCVTCHPSTVDATLTIVGADHHIDGIYTLGDGSQTCGACHGTENSGGAPAPGLSGETDDSTRAVGAHARHAVATSLHSAFGCDPCHTTPTGATFYAAVAASGHIDTALPAEVSLAGLAVADNATPTYDSGAGTCANTYCHSGGAKLAQDATTSIVRTLAWENPGVGPAACSSCHGQPPQITDHPNSTACWGCHIDTVNSGGSILFGADGLSTHVDGEVQR